MFPYICNDLLEMVGKEVVKIRDEATLDYWNEISADVLSGLDRHLRPRRRGHITDELALAAIHKLCDMEVDIQIHGRFLDDNLSPIDVIESSGTMPSRRYLISRSVRAKCLKAEWGARAPAP